MELQVQQHQLQFRQHLLQQQQILLQNQQQQILQQLQQSQCQLQLRQQEHENELPRFLRSVLDMHFDRSVQVLKRELEGVERNILSRINQRVAKKIDEAVRDQLMTPLAVLGTKADQSEDLSTSILGRLAALETRVTAIYQHLDCDSNQQRDGGRAFDTQSKGSSRVQSPLSEQQQQVEPPSLKQRGQGSSPSPGQQQQIGLPSQAAQQQQIRSSSPGQQQRMQSPLPGQQQQMQPSSTIQQQQKFLFPSFNDIKMPVHPKQQEHGKDEDNTDPKTLMTSSETVEGRVSELAPFALFGNENVTIPQKMSCKSPEGIHIDQNPHTLSSGQKRCHDIPGPNQSLGDRNGATFSLALCNNLEYTQLTNEEYYRGDKTKNAMALVTADNVSQKVPFCLGKDRISQDTAEFTDRFYRENRPGNKSLVAAEIKETGENRRANKSSVAAEIKETGENRPANKSYAAAVIKETEENRPANKSSVAAVIKETGENRPANKSYAAAVIKKTGENRPANKSSVAAEIKETGEKIPASKSSFVAEIKETGQNKPANNSSLAVDVKETKEKKSTETKNNVANAGITGTVEEKSNYEVIVDNEEKKRKNPKVSVVVTTVTASTATMKKPETDEPKRKNYSERVKSKQSPLKMSVLENGTRRYTWDLYVTDFSRLVNSGVEIASTVLFMDPLHVQGNINFLQGGFLQVWFAICKVDIRSRRHYSEGESMGLYQEEGDEGIGTKVRLNRTISEGQGKTSSQAATCLSTARVTAALVDPRNHLREMAIGQISEIQWHDGIERNGRWLCQQHRLGKVGHKDVIQSGYTRVGLGEDTAVVRYSVELTEK